MNTMRWSWPFWSFRYTIQPQHRPQKKAQTVKPTYVVPAPTMDGLQLQLCKARTNPIGHPRRSADSISLGDPVSSFMHPCDLENERIIPCGFSDEGRCLTHHSFMNIFKTLRNQAPMFNTPFLHEYIMVRTSTWFPSYYFNCYFYIECIHKRI